MHLIVNLPEERADTACETPPPRHHLATTCDLEDSIVATTTFLCT